MFTTWHLRHMLTIVSYCFTCLHAWYLHYWRYQWMRRLDTSIIFTYINCATRSRERSFSRWWLHSRSARCIPAHSRRNRENQFRIRTRCGRRKEKNVHAGGDGQNQTKRRRKREESLIGIAIFFAIYHFVISFIIS